MAMAITDTLDNLAFQREWSITVVWPIPGMQGMNIKDCQL